MNNPVEGKHIRAFLLLTRLGSFGLSHHGDAIGRKKVNGLSHIVGLGEAAVVGFEESADVVPWVLVSLVDGDAVIDEFERVHHECDAVEQSFLAGFQAVSFFDVGVEFLFMGARDHVPCLNSTLVVVVQRVDPQVLHVPAERRKLHAHVDPRMSDA